MRILLVVLILAVVAVSALLIHEARLMFHHNETASTETGLPPETESEAETEAEEEPAAEASSEAAEGTETAETLIIDPLIETASGFYPDLPHASGARVWVGDSRTEGIRLYVGGDPSADYFIDKVGEGYNWFTAEATPYLESMLASGNIGAVLIDLGVNDCAASVDYPDQFRAYDYAARINELIARYPEVLFVFYSVGPCSGGYARLNGEINRFNDVMQYECHAWYVDTARFLQTEGFNSTDGLHYDRDTCTRIYNFVIENI